MYYRFGFNAGSTESIEGTYILQSFRYCHNSVDISMQFYIFTLGKIAHAAVGRIALVMALAAASGGITSTIVSSLVQVAMLCDLMHIILYH